MDRRSMQPNKDTSGIITTFPIMPQFTKLGLTHEYALAHAEGCLKSNSG